MMTNVNGRLETLSSATAMSSITIPSGTVGVLLQAEGQNVRYTSDGTTPSSTNGMILIVGQNPVSFGGNVSSLKFLEVTSGGKVNCTFIVDKTAE